MKSKLLSVAILLTATVSCVDPQYDLVDKSLNKNISIFNEGIALPVGNVEKIMLSEFIETEEDGIIQEDPITKGYYLTKNGSADEINVNISGTKVDNEGFNLNQSFKTENAFKVLFQNPIFENTPDIALPIDVDALDVPDMIKDEIRTMLAENGLNGNKYEIPLDEENDTQFDININDIPTEIKSIKRIDVQPFNLEFSFNLDNLSYYTDVITLSEDFKLIIPDEIVTNDPDVIIDNITNEKYISFSNAEISENDNLKFNLTINAIEFKEKQDIIDGTLKYHGEFIISGNSYIDYFKSDSKEDDFINIPINISADPFSTTLTSSTGIFDFNVDPVNESIDIDKNDLPDFLSGENVIIDGTHASVELVIRSKKTANNLSGTLPADFQLKAEMSALKNGVTVSDPISETIILDKDNNQITEDENFCYYKYIISDNGETKDGYQTVIIDNLESLMRVIPDAINLNAEVNIGDGSTAEQTIETKDVNLLIDYSFRSPLEFGEDLNISYTDTLDGFHDTLKDIKTKGVKVAGKIEFEIPVDITLKAKALDIDNNILEGVNIYVTPEGKIKQGIQDFGITIETENPELISERLNGIELLITLGNENYTENGASQIKSTDFILLKELSLSILGGVSVDVNDF